MKNNKSIQTNDIKKHEAFASRFFEKEDNKNKHILKLQGANHNV